MNKKKTQRKIAATQETIAVIERDMKELKDKLKAATKLKGEERRTAVFKLERTEIRNMSNLLMSLENSIYAQEDEDEFHSHDQLKEKHKQFKNIFEQLKKQLEFIKNEGRSEREIFKNRNNNELNTKEEYAERIDKAQQESEMAVKNMLRMLQETKEIGNTVNLELERQLEALDSVNENLMETESTMKRAMRHIQYFARSVYTDKLLIFLVVLVVIAVVAIIILSAMGKVAGPTTDTLS